MSDPAAADPYWDGKDDILKAYAFDYEKIVQFRNKVAYANTLTGCCGLCLPCHFICERPNIKDATHAQHLAITRDGIRYVVDTHPSSCRFSCCDQGKTSKTVPFDKLTDCDVESPAGAETCCCIQRVLYIVQVDTASGSRDTGGHELTIVGLVDPEAFKRDVWSMKRGEGIEGVPDSITPTMMTRSEESSKKGASSWLGSGSSSGAFPSDVVPLLKEQNSLLSQAVGHLKTLASKA